MVKKTHPKTKHTSADSNPAKGGELHQVAGDGVPVLTTQQGTPVSDDQIRQQILGGANADSHGDPRA